MRKQSLSSAGILAAVTLGLIFLIAALGKFPAQTDAYTILLVLQKTPLLRALSDYVHIVIPLLELVIGLLLVSGVAARIAALGAAVMVFAFIFNNLWLLRKGLAQEPCGCFGGTLNHLLGFITTKDALYVDFGMLSLIGLILTLYPAHWFDLKLWITRVWFSRQPAADRDRSFD